jgi:flagellar hook-length control protein FliK
VNATQPTLLNLLGMAPVAPETITGKPDESGTLGVFDMIFQSFMAEPISAPLANMPNPELAIIDQPSNELPAIDGMLPIGEPAYDLATDSDGVNFFGQANALSLATAQNINSKLAVAQTKSPRILEAMTTSLPQGTYNISATTIEDGIVTFNLKAESTGQSLQVSIPLESIDTQLESAVNRTQNTNNNFATIRDGIDIEQLLTRANVTKIEISSEPNTTTQNLAGSKAGVDATQSVMAITANQQGKMILLFAAPRSAEIVAQTLPNVSQIISRQNAKHATSQTAIETMQAGVAPTMVQSKAQSPILDSTIIDEPIVSSVDSEETAILVVRPENVRGRSDATNLKTPFQNQWSHEIQIDSPDGGEVSSKNIVMAEDSSLGIATNSRTQPVAPNSLSQNGSVGTHTTHLPGSTFAKLSPNSEFATHSATEVTAGFTLPKEIEAMTLQTGQTKTVMLQLNPEHLGTARVHLTVQDDIVSARVVVDSHHAKAMVEGSLNELLTQFERANIRVEQIQVAVSGEWQNSEHNRRQFWHAPKPSAKFIKDSDDASDSITSAVAKLFTPKQTPAFAGLNILA